MQHLEYFQTVAPIVVGYSLGRVHQWSRTWRTTPLRERLEKAVDAFRKTQ